jgi:Uma2 family endonuclease
VIRTPTLNRATIDDLHSVEGKAELIGGRIVRFMATGIRPHRIATKIQLKIGEFADKFGSGEAFGDNLGYAVPELSSGRESFSPDASFYDGPLPANEMDFIPGPPTVAVEVRSKNDYGPAAELEMSLKRADYFEAGTLVVWDVDPIAETIAIYRHDSPDQPNVFGIGEAANAEPAMPGWTLPLSEVFR